MLLFSWPVKGLLPDCSFRASTLLRYSFSPEWTFSLWAATSASYRKVASSHRRHTRGPVIMGSSEKDRKASPWISAPATYGGTTHEAAAAWPPPAGDGDGGDGGRILRQHQPPPHHAQGSNIPFGCPLTPI